VFDFVYLFPGLSLWMQKNVLSLGSGRTLLIERFSGAMLVPALVLVFGYLPTLTSLFPTLNRGVRARCLVPHAAARGRAETPAMGGSPAAREWWRGSQEPLRTRGCSWIGSRPAETMKSGAPTACGGGEAGKGTRRASPV